MIAKRFKNALPLGEITPYIPGRPHKATVHRWASHGVRGVKLTTIMVGGRRMVTMDAIEKFLAALNADSAVESVDDVSRRSAEAGDALERLGC